MAVAARRSGCSQILRTIANPTESTEITTTSARRDSRNLEVRAIDIKLKHYWFNSSSTTSHLICPVEVILHDNYLARVGISVPKVITQASNMGVYDLRIIAVKPVIATFPI